MPSPDHPLHHSGGNWPLGVILLLSLLALATSAWIAHRALAPLADSATPLSAASTP